MVKKIAYYIHVVVEQLFMFDDVLPFAKFCFSPLIQLRWYIYMLNLPYKVQAEFSTEVGVKPPPKTIPNTDHSKCK